MIQLHMRPELELKLREYATTNGYALTTVAIALMQLGLTHSPEDIRASCAQHARPSGRPAVLDTHAEAKDSATADKPIMSTLERLKWGKYRKPKEQKP